MIKFSNRIIEYSFYLLFFLVPLVFTSDTYELFEFSKMWLTFGLTLIIAAAWGIKSVLQRRILLCRTPLDIPILLFLISQIISTIFSLDAHISIWGYYSRWNGGLLSIISYIFLYYAFVSNLGSLIVKRLLKISLISGLIVALWGLPSHFGYDPTCLLFRGSLDVSCWTNDFQPKIRMFSTLGQPAWLAAYLAILIPIAIAFFLNSSKTKVHPVQYQISNIKYQISNNWRLDIGNLKLVFILFLTVLFYLSLLWTSARSGFIAIWISLAFFFVILIFIIKNNLKFEIGNLKLVFITVCLLFGITFFIGSPVQQLNKFTYQSLVNRPSSTPSTSTTFSTFSEKGGTDSGEIRKIVWKGAIDAWKNNPVFGTGVETFAFAYYKSRPAEHNLVSEWDYLYNKAHNEFLNYLTTTGIFGLGTYLAMIFVFFKVVLAKLGVRDFRKDISDFSENNQSKFQTDKLLIIALLSSLVSILITNFFGFSVVITNIYLFLIPAFVFVLNGMVNPIKVFAFPKSVFNKKIENRKLMENGKCLPAGKAGKMENPKEISFSQWFFLSLIILATFYIMLKLFSFYQADKSYSLGYNLDRIGQYQEGYLSLKNAIGQRGDEPVFKDEISLNSAILGASYLYAEKNSGEEKTKGKELIDQAVSLSSELNREYPNNVVFLKTRVKVFYTLSQIDEKYSAAALEAIISANRMAPTDAKISYNLGLLYAQNGFIKEAAKTLENTKLLKPDYRDAIYALGLYYREQAIDKNNKIVNYDMQKKAAEEMRYLLKLNKTDTQAQQSLKNWRE